MSTLTLNEIAKAARISRDTVKRLERKGVLQPKRDCNGWRFFTIEDAELLCARYGRQTPPDLYK